MQCLSSESHTILIVLEDSMQCDVECLQMEKKKKTWNVQINTNASEFCWSNFLPVLVPCTFIQRFAMVSNRHFSQWWQVKNYLSCLALICWTPYPNVGCNFLARIDGHFRMSTNRERKNWNSGASTDEKEWNYRYLYFAPSLNAYENFRKW